MRTIEKIKVNHEAIEMVQALYEDYRAKQDLLTMIFELHKNDTDGSVIDSKPFETYEKKFMKTKIKYDTAMKELQENYIPDQYKKGEYTFEVNFEEDTLDIKEND